MPIVFMLLGSCKCLILIGNGKMELDWKAVKLYVSSKSWFIVHLQDQRVTGYHSFPDIEDFT
jgi:hypothetical protein